MQRTDVLVVGGGPAGLALAASVDGDVVVVHRDPQIGWPVRTSGGSWKRAIDDLGLPDSLYNPISSVTFASSSEQCSFRYSDDCPVVLDVTKTFMYLAKQAEAHGSEIRCGHKFVDIVEESGDWIVSRIVSREGQYELKSKIVVDASGFRRAVLSANNVSGQKKRFGVGLEYEFADLSARHDHATLFVGTRFAPAGYGWIFPSNKSTVRVGIGIIRPDTDTSPKEHLKDFVNSQQLDRFSVRIGDLLEMHSGVIPANRIPMNFGLGRVIAVGDSVNQALPLLGEGIRYSIECGRKLGEIIKEGRQRGDRPSSMLLRYMKWWDARYRWTFWLAQRVNETISRYDDAHWDRGIRRLSRLSPHDVGLLMRMELDPWMCMRIAAANPDLPFRAIRKCAKMILHLP